MGWRAARPTRELSGAVGREGEACGDGVNGLKRCGVLMMMMMMMMMDERGMMHGENPDEKRRHETASPHALETATSRCGRSERTKAATASASASTRESESRGKRTLTT